MPIDGTVIRLANFMKLIGEPSDVLPWNRSTRKVKNGAQPRKEDLNSRPQQNPRLNHLLQSLNNKIDSGRIGAQNTPIQMESVFKIDRTFQEHFVVQLER